MHELERLLAERVAAGLKQKSLTVCSKWACANRIMGQPFPGPFSFKYHPWLRELHDCKSERIICQKAAQVGFTECALNKVFFKISIERIDCLYVLPAAQPDATRFSSSRFDVALELSPSLNALFTNVKNVHHKRAGSANLYVTGSHSRSALKSIPVGFIVFDEVDEMVQDNIPLAFHRAAGQRSWQAMLLSTPTADDYGINKFYVPSTQEHFFFKCPACGRRTEFTFPECLKITAEEITDPRLKESHYICKECKNTLHHEDKPNFLASGIWVPQYPGRDDRGFQISQMYSSTQYGTPYSLAQAAINARNNIADEQELYNSRLARTHIPEGAKVNDNQLNSCIGNFGTYLPKEQKLYTMGIDVGRWCHYVIEEWTYTGSKSTDPNASVTPKIIGFGKVREFYELDELMHRYRVLYAVIDAQPERRASLDFAMRFPGHVSVCYYSENVRGKTISMANDNSEEPIISVDRTSWLDASQTRFQTKRIYLPSDINQEFRDHIKALIRVPKKDEDGNITYRYVKTGDDHYAHARNYSELALKLALMAGHNSNITQAVF